MPLAEMREHLRDGSEVCGTERTAYPGRPGRQWFSLWECREVTLPCVLLDPAYNGQIASPALLPVQRADARRQRIRKRQSARQFVAKAV